MASRIAFAFLFVARIFASCSDSDAPEVDASKGTPLVIEGWIEYGETPIVMVTRAVDLTQDAPSFDDFVEKWCRVSIFDEEQQYILIGKKNNAYMPSFIFTNNRLKGKIGHTYRIVVESDNNALYSRVDASATLEEAPEIIETRSIPLENVDSLYKIGIKIKNCDPEGYYKIYTQTLNSEGHYYPAYMSTLKGVEIDSERGMEITRGFHTDFHADIENDYDEEISKPDDETEQSVFSHFFKRGEVVKIKICRISKENYEFWKTYDANISLSNNMFLTFTENCPSNIPGALGYWGAWGKTETAIVIE